MDGVDGVASFLLGAFTGFFAGMAVCFVAEYHVQGVVEKIRGRR